MSMILTKHDFFYKLPEERIARYPLAERSAAKMLVIQPQGQEPAWQDSCIRDIPELLCPGDLMVMNNTRVIPARMYGHKASGGKVEVLIERLSFDTHSQKELAYAHIRAAKSPKAQSTLQIGAHTIHVLGREDELFILTAEAPWSSIMQEHGEMPIPPYLARRADVSDSERYQTVYASTPGAVAAPTAGLHFDQKLLTELRQKGVEECFITLHVGAGTFQPVRCDNLDEHLMHAEWLEVSADTVERIRACKARGNRVLAVGTTSLRALESAAASGELRPYQGETRLFIRPGYRFRCVDMLLSNFHLPESTLLMLVSAFSGVERIRAAYQHAIDAQYRFYSYGDATLLTAHL